jgi:hypothetical protein
LSGRNFYSVNVVLACCITSVHEEEIEYCSCSLHVSELNKSSQRREFVLEVRIQSLLDYYSTYLLERGELVLSLKSISLQSHRIYSGNSLRRTAGTFSICQSNGCKEERTSMKTIQHVHFIEIGPKRRRTTVPANTYPIVAARPPLFPRNFNLVLPLKRLAILRKNGPARFVIDDSLKKKIVLPVKIVRPISVCSISFWMENIRYLLVEDLETFTPRFLKCCS